MGSPIGLQTPSTSRKRGWGLANGMPSTVTYTWRPAPDSPLGGREGVDTPAGLLEVLDEREGVRDLQPDREGPRCVLHRVLPQLPAQDLVVGLREGGLTAGVSRVQEGQGRRPAEEGAGDLLVEEHVAACAEAVDAAVLEPAVVGAVTVGRTTRRGRQVGRRQKNI